MAKVMVLAQVLVPGDGAIQLAAQRRVLGKAPPLSCFSTKDLIKPLLCQYC